MLPYSLRRVLLAVSLFLLLAIGLPLAAPTLNGLKPAGLPLGFWVSAQLAPLLMAAAALWLASGTSRP